jgi:FkbM family methyltransferase
LDVGANVGVTAVHFAAECGAGTVHSFEPVPRLYDLLCQNTAGLAAVVPHDYGIFSRTCTKRLTFYPGAASMSSLYADPERDRALVRQAVRHERADCAPDPTASERFRAEEIEAEMLTLSAAIEAEGIGEIDLLKIDVEGAERDVIASVSAKDWDRIRQVSAEVHDRESLDELERTLTNRGFRVRVGREPVLRGTPISMLYAIRQ